MKLLLFSAVVLLGNVTLPGEVEEANLVWRKLMLLVQNEQRPTAMRGYALDSACKNADAEGADELIAMTRSWISEIDRAACSNEEMERDASLHAKYLLVQQFASRSGARVCSASLDEAAMLEMWTLLATRPWLAPLARECCYNAVARSPVVSQLKRDAAITILRDGVLRRQATIPDSLSDLLDASTLPEIRLIVRESLESDTLHIGAASVLAHHGDSEMVTGFEQLLSAKGESDPALGRTLTWFLWQIRTQNPPSRLLAHISSADSYSPESRGWAIDRALELGMPAPAIRQAILRCAASYEPPHPRRTRYLLVGLRSHGFARRIIEESDIPDVPFDSRPSYDKSMLLRRPQPYVPDLLIETPEWEPQEENYQALFAWMRQIPWSELDALEGHELFKRKLRELNLSPPVECEDPGATE